MIDNSSKKNIRILCLSGSLRKASYNTAVIHALRELAPRDVEVVIFDGMAQLPLFNPDLDDAHPLPVQRLRNELEMSDGLLIASPEYAHGISGVLKNALDWLVSGAEFPYMPVALINTSPRASHAQAALREVIATMSGRIIDVASVAVPLLGSHLDVRGIVSHPEIAQTLIQAIVDFRHAILEHGGSHKV